MPFEPVLAADIKLLLQTLASNTDPNADSDAQMDAFANGLALAIQKALMSATITIPTGMINVVGSPSTQSNPAPIILTGVIA